MERYESVKNKISRIYEKTYKLQDDVDKLKNLNVKYKTVTYNVKGCQQHILLEAGIDTYYYADIKLEGFPEEALPFLKVIIVGGGGTTNAVSSHPIIKLSDNNYRLIIIIDSGTIVEKVIVILGQTRGYNEILTKQK